MASSTRSKLLIPNSSPSLRQLFQLAKAQLLKENDLLLPGVPNDLALPLIEGLESDKQIYAKGKYRYNFEKGQLTAFMPTPIHDSVQCVIQDVFNNMVDTNFLSWNQRKKLMTKVGTTYDKFTGIHAGTVKQADVWIKVDGRQIQQQLSFCPVWVNECGYSETTPKLRRDITKWLAGTGFGVLLAIQSKFYRRKNSRVAGDLVFYSNNGTRVITKSIFSIPPNPIDDRIVFTRQELFGDSLALEPGQNLADNYVLEMSFFRNRAIEWATVMGLTPV